MMKKLLIVPMCMLLFACGSGNQNEETPNNVQGPTSPDMQNNNQGLDTSSAPYDTARPMNQ